jgi:DNA-directed RNA polymerase subunit RPC12/RpoP
MNWGRFMQFSSEETTDSAPCPKCGFHMILAAITRHPVATQMQRHTYVCVPCNRTKTYMMPALRPPAEAASFMSS